jgi:hypothetical protein
MLPLYATRIEDLRQGDFATVNCAACHHVALLAPEFLARLGLSLETKLLDLKERVRGLRPRGSRAGRWQCAGADRGDMKPVEPPSVQARA